MTASVQDMPHAQLVVALEAELDAGGKVADCEHPQCHSPIGDGHACLRHQVARMAADTQQARADERHWRLALLDYRAQASQQVATDLPDLSQLLANVGTLLDALHVEAQRLDALATDLRLVAAAVFPGADPTAATGQLPDLQRLRAIEVAARAVVARYADVHRQLLHGGTVAAGATGAHHQAQVALARTLGSDQVATAGPVDRTCAVLGCGGTATHGPLGSSGSQWVPTLCASNADVGRPSAPPHVCRIKRAQYGHTHDGRPVCGAMQCDEPALVDAGRVSWLCEYHNRIDTSPPRCSLSDVHGTPCMATATHGPGGMAVACWAHAGDMPRVLE